MKKLLGVCFFLMVQFVWSQSSDIVRIEYTTLPKKKSSRSISRFRFLANLPIKLNDKNYIIAGAEYGIIDFANDSIYEFDDNELEKLRIVDLNLGYAHMLNDKWTFVGLLTPRLASNFIDGVQKEDFNLNYSVLTIKADMKKEKPTRLILGLSYNNATGFDVPLPIISYYKKFHPNWSYMIGVPRMEFKYHLKQHHTFKTALLLDGYFVNVQNDIALPDNDLGSGLSLSVVVGAFGYQYNINKNISFYALAGHTLSQRGLLRDEERKSVYSLYDDGNVYFKTGFKIGIF
ncbi:MULTISPECIES: DUF6268 family outer membrane beta-barrel protein [Cellulophaga]|uniref:DUF6268 domain-containing protein n=1 Tax=Cellulophaga geojensis KL-A TaxID=1328323 RepID=A0ABP3B4N4_9FLAO|nr:MULTISPECIES: DUF6268 family outer membrane beta-barrel protein [Cellulophaga]AIM59239.1 hypothetical protein IX49_01345 [Cellulophaga lytica]APU09053.1 hypothetical protein A5M85_01735 [Cellulophaga lytica]EWH12755.1 hypothetical protein KLA_13254 [Cellulophaga geojensis KL-A]SNQ42933.1 conserved exported hypothetical protein [Cellulophaga lytica]